MSTGARRGPGRPADDGADRRQAILDAAREQFAEKGYAGASVRAIAHVADVDPALVHHHFGSKEKVFVAAMELPFVPAERLARMFLGMWADPTFRTPMLGLVRSAFTTEQGATMLREFVGTALLARVAQAVGPVDPLRVQVVGCPAGGCRDPALRRAPRTAGIGLRGRARRPGGAHPAALPHRLTAQPTGQRAEPRFGAQSAPGSPASCVGGRLGGVLSYHSERGCVRCVCSARLTGAGPEAALR